MNEDLPNQNQPDEQEWQAPPLPEEIRKTDAHSQMSEAGTLANIFFEPGATFEDLRRKPRFILAMLIMIILFSAFNVLFTQKIGIDNIVRARLEKNPQIQQMSEKEKQDMVAMQSGTIGKVLTYAAPPIVLVIYFLIGGLIYWLGANAMGGSATFLRGVSVWVYSSFPATVVSSLANILILFLKSADDIDITTGQQGLIHANPSFFMDTKAMPVLSALIGTLDVFFIWGWILAAIGLRIVGKISTGSAWAIVLIVGLLNVAARVVGALFS